MRKRVSVFSPRKRSYLLLGITVFSYVSGLLPQPRDVQKTPPAVLGVSHASQQTTPSPKTVLKNVSQIGKTQVIARQATPTPTTAPPLQPTPTPSDISAPSPTAVPVLSEGAAIQIGKDTWSMRVQADPVMATAQEIFQALNVYRQTQGSSTLVWDGVLAAYAQSRADFFTTAGKLDEHAGFTDYLNNQDGFSKLGYNSVGENSSIGYTLSGIHLIEWVYAGDKPHNDNQLNTKWSAVGIGVSGTATDLIFAGSKK